MLFAGQTGISGGMYFRCVARVVGLWALAALARAAESTPPAQPASEPVPDFPIGWTAQAHADSVAQAKTAGFDYIDLGLQGLLTQSPEEFVLLVARLRTLKLRVLAGYNVVPRELRLVGPAIDLERQADHLALLITRAQLLKLDYLILDAGAAWRMPEGMKREDAFKQLTAFCRRFALVAGERQMTVLIGPRRATETNLITTLAEAIALVEAVSHPNFQLVADYAVLRDEKDAMAQLRKAGAHLRHVQIANPEKTPRAFPLEKGESNYAEFFTALKAIGYRGGLTIYAGSADFGVEAPRAIAFLREEARALAK